MGVAVAMGVGVGLGVGVGNGVGVGVAVGVGVGVGLGVIFEHGSRSFVTPVSVSPLLLIRSISRSPLTHGCLHTPHSNVRFVPLVVTFASSKSRRSATFPSRPMKSA